MSSGRRTLWNALVWALVPFILGAGLPQMQCRCAAAKGQRWCECCFQKPSALVPTDSKNEKPCCQRRMANIKDEKLPSPKAAAGCQTCRSHANSTTGSCCDLKGSEALTLSKQIEPPACDVSFIGRPAIEWQQAAISRSAEVWPRQFERPTLDRVVVFAHLLI
ncbi:MAG: hypothetical protein DWI21_08605 [Planctomycetota bacterium]|nr:MAG: hypothetical protein DWI21_08605 [Planctomycetota bacterium]